MVGRSHEKGATMAHSNAGLIEGAYASFAQGDIAALMAIWTDDIVWHVGGSNPFTGDHSGKEDVAGFLGGVVQATGGTLRVELQNAMADDTTGYSLHTSTATKDGEELVAWDILGYRFDNGKVAEIWSFAFDQQIDDRQLS